MADEMKDDFKAMKKLCEVVYFSKIKTETDVFLVAVNYPLISVNSD